MCFYQFRRRNGSSSNLVANFCSGSRQDFRKLGKSKLLTSSATQLNTGHPLKYAKSPLKEGVTRKKLESQREALQHARRRSIADAVASNAPESVEQVLDADFLALVVATTLVKANRHFFELESAPS